MSAVTNSPIAFALASPVTHRAQPPLLRTRAATPLRTAPVTHHRRLAAHPAPVMALDSVVIAGGSGFVGSRLASALAAKGSSVTVLTRKSGVSTAAGVRAVTWPGRPGQPNEAWSRAVRGADLVVCLAGEPVVSRWDMGGKDRIRNSRLDSTGALVEAIAELPAEERPRCFVGASAVGYYGFEIPDDSVVDEAAEPGKDFLADLCVSWEGVGEKQVADLGVRAASARLGIVLGAGGGALAKMIPAFQLFVGGALGSGKQWVPWVHVDDVVKAIERIGEDQSMSGAYNLTAPNAVRMSELCSALGRALNRPSLFPVPGFVIKAGLGQASCVLLEGQNVAPARLEQSGFEFDYKTIDDALKAVVSEL